MSSRSSWLTCRIGGGGAAYGTLEALGVIQDNSHFKWLKPFFLLCRARCAVPARQAVVTAMAPGRPSGSIWFMRIHAMFCFPCFE